MATAARFLIAIAMLVSQVSYAIVCGCPETPLPKAVAQAKCSMSQQPNCACCCKKASGHEATVRSLGRCQIRSVGSVPTVKHTPTPGEHPAAAVEPAKVFQVPHSVAVEQVDAQLIVPRIRPPNPRLHGLRAPPAF